MQSSSAISSIRHSSSVETNNNPSYSSIPNTASLFSYFNGLRSSRSAFFYWNVVTTMGDTAIAALGVVRRLLPATAAASAAIAIMAKDARIRFDSETVLKCDVVSEQGDSNGNHNIVSGTRSFPMQDIQGLTIANTKFLVPAMIASVLLYNFHKKISCHIELAKLKQNISSTFFSSAINIKYNFQKFRAVASVCQQLGVLGIHSGLMAWFVSYGLKPIGFEGLNNLRLGNETQTYFNLQDTLNIGGEINATTIIANGLITTPAIYTRGISAEHLAVGFFSAGMAMLIIGKMIDSYMQKLQVNTIVQKYLANSSNESHTSSVAHISTNIINELTTKGLMTNKMLTAIRKALTEKLTLDYPHLLSSASTLNQEVSIQARSLDFLQRNFTLKKFAFGSDYSGNLCLLSVWICYNFSKGFPGISAGYNGLQTSPATRFESALSPNNSTIISDFQCFVEFAPTQLQNIKSDLILPLFFFGIALKSIGLFLHHAIAERDLKKTIEEILISSRFSEHTEWNVQDLKELSTSIIHESISKNLIAFEHTQSKYLFNLQSISSLNERVNARLNKFNFSQGSTMRQSTPVADYKKILKHAFVNTLIDFPIQALYMVAGAGASLGIFMLLTKDLAGEGIIQAQQPTQLNANITVMSEILFGAENNPTFPIKVMSNMDDFPVANPSKVTLTGVAIGLGAAVVFGGIGSFLNHLHQQYMFAKTAVNAVQDVVAQAHTAQDLESV